MNKLRISIEHIQHIDSLSHEIDVSGHGLRCLVGRNGAGKTTLVRALRNLSNADTFVKTAPPYIFRNDSRIIYDIDGAEITFSYDAGLRSLNCRQQISAEIRKAISAELPIPHGARFNFVKSASLADDEIRRSIALESYGRPQELIDFLNEIYESTKYARLIEVSFKGQSYYAIARPDGTYLREDYLSSGEYFLINLYRTIKSQSKLIVIDEIDLSLDAAAQAKLTHWLRSFCRTYGCTILFTTHSLAIMKTLEATELAYLDCQNAVATITPASYSYVKARLFGFRGWDRYILTEDKVLVGFIEHLVERHCPPSFFSYKVIYIGGGSQVVDLLSRNSIDGFLGKADSVIAVLDGDRSRQSYSSAPSVFLIPMENLENSLYELWQTDTNFPFSCAKSSFTSPKDFFSYLQQKRIATLVDIYSYLVSIHQQALEPLVKTLSEFLARPDDSSPEP